MTTRLRSALVVLLLSLPGAALAQQPVPDTTGLQEVRLADGSVLYGTVLRDGDPLHLRLLSGDTVQLARQRIRRIRPARGRVVDGEFWREDPNQTRLFFGPTARGMEEGSGYLAGYFLVMPFLGIAISEDVVLAGGTPFFGGFDDRPFWLAPKVRVKDGPTHDLALGALVFAIEDESAGVLYGVSTWGSSDQAVTLGVGYGFVNGDLADRPMVMGGFEIRAGPNLKLLSENYLFPGGVGLLSIGPRFFGERLSADLGLGVAVDSDGESATFPIINFVYVW